MFAFKINYDQPEWDANAAKGLFNGNISETKWINGNDNTGVVRGYGYLYDNLNRLTNATYQTPSLTNNKNYFGESMDYDKNGNIQHLMRQNMGGGSSNSYVGGMDDLTYDYADANSNQLTKVTDGLGGNDSAGFIDGNKTGDDYAYDANGNMITDKNKNITTIAYNHLNLPKKITFGITGSIDYIYNAAGQKLRKIVTEGAVEITTDYLGGFQYKDNVLQFFPTAEGYVKNDAGMLSYVFQYKDHLGNIRLSYAKNPTTNVLEIIEENNYYPFGLKHNGYNNTVTSTNPAQKLLYNGKELQDELGLNFYYYGARNYDPALGRWINIDPKGEKYLNLSPYIYVADNPIINIDPDGNDIIFIVTRGDQTRNFKYSKGNFYDTATGKRYNPGKESVSPTMYKVLSAYRKIEKSNNSRLKGVLHKLETSKLHHYIEEGVKSVVNAYGITSEKEGDLSIGTRTHYNFSHEDDAEFEKDEGAPVSDDATVAHEMRHQYDHDIGNTADSQDGGNEKDPVEIRAVFFENLMRKLLKQMQRPNYGKPIEPKILKNPPNNRFEEEK
ncbi:RHS repeat domain-containing protein [Flavobacterium geliluteum]|uniref:RHS repeat domain-containing protein n=1 Tax=Flavobacterium geliluteum TaxID=2816120 RepID=UPI001F4505D7|nr:RHS repeat-associated core domain-containing protein [Flavobacterium geliluteum]